VESKDQDPQGTVRLTQLADVGDGKFRNKSSRFMTRAAAERLRCTFLEKGDVLIARMPDPIGRACVFPGLEQPAVTAVDVMIWRTDGELVQADFFVRWINSPAVRLLMANGAGGTTRQRIAGGRIRDIELPLPPKAEQRRIVAKLDALTARLNHARSELDRIPELARRERDAILENAYLEGGRSHWPELKLSDTIEDGLIGLVRSKVEQGTSGSPYIRMNHYDFNGQINTRNLTSVSCTRAEQQRYEILGGDVLFNTRNSTELVGKVALWPDHLKGYVYNNNILRLRFKPLINPLFAFRYMMSPTFRRLTERMKSATTSVAAIYQRALYDAPFPVPPLEEQEMIVDRIEATFARTHCLEAEAARARALLDRLESAILAKAFRGELVPQDPNDEPASVLLDRIRAERATAPRPKRGRRTAATA
jgi:type I restriction enzyme S subunit